MAKAIITIDDSDTEAPSGFSVEVTFDPPIPEDRTELEGMKPPVSLLVALKLIEVMNANFELESATPITTTEH